MKRFLHLSLIIAILLPQFAALLSVMPVSALDNDWCYTFLNGNGRGVLEILEVDNSIASYDAGNDRFVGGIYEGGTTFRSSNILIRLQTSEPFTVTSVTEYYTLTQYTTSTPNDYIRDVDAGEYIVVDEHSTSGSFTTTASDLDIFTSTLWFRTGAYGTNIHMPANYLTQIVVCGTSEYQPPELGGEIIIVEGDLVRPLAPADEHPDWEMFDWDYITTLDTDWEENINEAVRYETFAFSQNYGADVHAAVEGLVTNVEWWGDSCETCGYSFYIPDVIQTDGDTAMYQLNVIDVYRVDLRYFDGENFGIITYIVANAPDYVNAGDTIREGCILGQTLQLKHVPESWGTSVYRFLWGMLTHNVISDTLGIDIEPPDNKFDRPPTNPAGVTILVYTNGLVDTALPLFPYLTIDSPLDQACNINQSYAACYGDPEFTHPEQWNTTGVVAFNSPGVTLSTSLSSVSQVLPLSAGTAYSMTVQAQKSGVGDGRIKLKIGATESEFAINTDMGQAANYFIDSAIHDPDYSGYYTIGIYNTGTAPLRINSVCVTDGEPNPTINSCYFYNAFFEQGTGGWTVSGGVSAYNGVLAVPSGETFAQDVHLWPDDGITPYTIASHISLLTTLPEIPNTDWTSTVELDYEWPTSSGWVPITSPSSSTTAYFAQFATDPVMLFSWDFNVLSETDGTWTFKPTLTTSNPDITGIVVWDVCLSYGYNNPFPGDPGDTGTDPPFNPVCQHIGPPADNSVGSWLSWHWAHLNRFFECELMVILNQLAELITQFKEMVGWGIRYIIATARYVANWLRTDVFPWLEGHLYNLAVGQVVVIDDGEGGVLSSASIGSDIWDWVTGGLGDLVNWIVDGIINALRGLFGWIIDAVNWIFNVLINVILTIAGIALNVLGTLLNSANQAIGRIADFVNAWNNATPQPIAGLPMCEVNPKESSFCIVLWMFEHTVFSGRGALIPYLLVFAASVELLIWWLGRLQKTVEKVSQST